MPEGLQTADGQAVTLEPPDLEFERAMAAPEPNARPDYPAPPRRDPAAPLGRDDKGNPLAPYGYKADGVPRMNPPGPGRYGKSKDDQSRTRKAAKSPVTGRFQAAKTAEPVAEARARRAQDATDTMELLGAAGSLLSMIMGAKARTTYAKASAAGNKAVAQKAGESADRATVLQLDAAAFIIHADGVGASAAEAAGKNAMAAALIDRLALFNGVASVGLTVLPLVYQLAANHAPADVRNDMPPELMQLGVLPPSLLLEKLQAQNAVKMARMQSAILAEKQEAEAELAALRENEAA